MKTYAEILKDRGITAPVDLDKYNHNHDAKGQFSSADGAAFVTLPKPGSSSKPKEMGTSQGGGSGAGGQSAAEEGKEPSKQKSAARGHIEDEGNYNMQEELGITEEAAEKYQAAVYRYTDVGMYSKIRAVQTGEIEGKPAVKKMGDDLEEFIQKSPTWNGGKIYRGIAADKDTVDSMKKGTILDMQGTSSWSSNQYTPKEFAAVGNAERSIIFTLPGTKQGTSVRHISSYKDQDEVIISKTAKFTIKSTKERKNYTEVELEEVE